MRWRADARERKLLTEFEESRPPPRIERVADLPVGELLSQAREFRREARARMDQRRDYEWKVSLGVWTTSGVTLASLIANLEDLSFSLIGRILATIIIVTFLLAHVWFLWGFIFVLNASDKFQALQWEDFIIRHLGGEPESIASRAGRGAVAVAFESLLTTTLASAIALAVWSA
jgi:hypothetical protein